MNQCLSDSAQEELNTSAKYLEGKPWSVTWTCTSQKRREEEEEEEEEEEKRVV